MLRQASVHQLRAGSFDRQSGHVAICMCFYPRNLPKETRDEYLAHLAPDRALFAEWKAAEKNVGHEAAFAKVEYEDRFTLSPKALDDLQRLSNLSDVRDVFLVCQCTTGVRCHREILLLTAAAQFGAKIGNVYHQYPRFLARLPNLIAAWQAETK